MNDRFKFRTWDKPTSTMFYDVALGFIKAPLTGDWVCVDTPEGQISYTGKRLNDIELMQSTGLKDKSGTLIYEGDILRLKDIKIPVEVRFKGIGFELYAEPSNMAGYHNNKYIPEDCEIIGNIYENKELLEEG